jgi:hypothetical protein|tara:strand:- start:915 stop:1079 length:165 start_codon:yes stop_codon:yes gene_type:complete
LREEESRSTDEICIYIFGKSLLVLGFLFPSSSVFSPPPSKKLTPKEKGEHRREL